jgi:enterochelin esterase-like enzyme
MGPAASWPAAPAVCSRKWIVIGVRALASNTGYPRGGQYPGVVKTRSAFVADLVAEGLDRTPLATPSGVAFVYQGVAEDVEVVVMEDRFPEVGPMEQIPGSKTWFAETPLHADGSIEYKLAITNNGKRRLILDPANPDRSSAPFGSNSVASGHGYQPPAWLGEAQSEPGTIRQLPIESKVWGQTKHHQLLLPAGFTGEHPMPLLVLHDGPEYVEYAGFQRCFDWLVGNGRIPPMLVLLHRPHVRNAEYVGNPIHSSHLIEEVLPEIRSICDVGPVYAGGASLGAVASLTLSFEYPGAVSGLMLQSGSFVRKLGGPFHRGPVLKPVVEILPRILEQPELLPDRLVFSCGTYDGLVEDHRQLIPELSDRLPGVSYQELNAGHHWRCWRDALESDLLTLLDSA